MTDSQLDPFADAMIERDGYGRPKVWQPDGTTAPYTRASTFAGTLDDGGGLTYWKVQHAALGVARHPDIAAQVAGLKYKDRSLPALIEDAITRTSDAAAWGTAVHSFTDPDPSPFVPDRMVADVDSCHAKMAELGITQVLSEQFVVCDEIGVAGTFDGTYNVPGDLLRAAGYTVHPGESITVVGDKKTGDIHMRQVGIQCAAYSRGQLYTPNPDGTATREHLGVRQDVAILIHIPKGQGVTEIYPVSLVDGWADALLAKAIRDGSTHDKLPAPLGTVVEPATRAGDDAAVYMATVEKPKRKRRTKAEMAAARAAEAAPVEVDTAEKSMQADYEADIAAGEDAAVTPYVDGEPVNRDTGELTPDTRLAVMAGGSPASDIETIKADIAAERQRVLDATAARYKAGLVAEAEAKAAAALAKVQAEQARVAAMTNADRIAAAPSVDALVALFTSDGPTWTDDDKALATARRNLLIAGVTTAAVTA